MEEVPAGMETVLVTVPPEVAENLPAGEVVVRVTAVPPVGAGTGFPKLSRSCTTMGPMVGDEVAVAVRGAEVMASLAAGPLPVPIVRNPRSSTATHNETLAQETAVG